MCVPRENHFSKSLSIWMSGPLRHIGTRIVMIALLPTTTDADTAVTSEVPDTGRTKPVWSTHTQRVCLTAKHTSTFTIPTAMECAVSMEREVTL